jgi:hypothetical protein
MASPIFLKRRENDKHLTYLDEEFENALNENAKSNLKKLE